MPETKDELPPARPISIIAIDLFVGIQGTPAINISSKVYGTPEEVANQIGDAIKKCDDFVAFDGINELGINVIKFVHITDRVLMINVLAAENASRIQLVDPIKRHIQ